MSFRLMLAAPALILLAPVAAQASPVNSTEFEAEVAHDDLDLTTREGITRLDERVRTKVRQLCQNGGRDSASVRLERECRDSTLAATAPEIDMAISNAWADDGRLAQHDAASLADTPGA